MRKILFLLFIFFYSQAYIAEYGFVTFATKSYFSLLKVMLDSVKAFSNYPVVAFGINDDIPFSLEKYPFLVKRRIDIGKFSRERIFLEKSRIILESGLKYGICIEADDIVNKGVDKLFDYCKQVENYPLCPIHPQDPDVLGDAEKLMNVCKRTMPYVQGHVIFSYKCMPFIQEWREYCLKFAMRMPAFDSTIMNVLLWKYNATNYIPYVFDPFYKTSTYYINGLNEQKLLKPNGYDIPTRPYMFHGCKDSIQSRKILNNLISWHAKKSINL